MIRFRYSILLVILFVAGCSTPGSKIDVSAEIKKIRDSDRALLSAETQRDLEGVMGYIAEGAVFHPPDIPPVVGHKAIRDFYNNWFEVPYSGIVCDSDTVIISSSFDLGCLVGNSHMEFETPAGKNRLSGKYITVWRKMNDKWLCVAVSWSRNELAD